MTAGIMRVHIDGDWDDWRTQMARNLAPAADRIYQAAFSKIGLPLLPGNEDIHCTKEEAVSRYDWKEGIDVLLYFQSGGKATLQEKFLTFYRSTVTFEETKTSGKPGAWYYCTAQYWFTGYARNYKDQGILEFQDWMLNDLSALKRADGQGLIPWSFNKNRKDNRRAKFRYVPFDKIPSSCVVARYVVSQRVQLPF